jgi:hypothetical protein
VLAFYYVISSYPYWEGTSSFSNRFFVSLTPIFIVGLGQFFQTLSRVFSRRNGTIVAGCLVALTALWNAGFIFQWGTQMIPSRGAISWKQMVHNQFVVVPRRLASDLEHYLFRREAILQRIELQDLERRQSEVQDRMP